MADVPHAWLLRWLKVPSERQLPEGTVRVFNAAPAYLNYRRVLLALKQVGVLAGTVAGWFFISRWVPMILDFPYTRPLMYALEAFVWVGYLVMFPVSFFVIRLDYELRWYALTDRSLRVHEGVTSLREKTMTFANIQQISIQQNPLQRLLGIADVKVETAGGGSGGRSGDADLDPAEHLHEARFRGVSDPEAIRDAILERVRLHRDAGLGEPTELATRHEEPAAAVGSTGSPVAAAQELLTEVRELRGALASRRAS